MMNEHDTTAETVLSHLKRDDIKFVHLTFSDLIGQPKIVTVDVNRMEDIFRSGLWFDGSSIEGFGRIAESDMLLRPDFNTYAVIPWTSTERRAARLICYAYTTNGEPLAADPRHILKNECDKAAALGLTLKIGAEIEFYLMERAKMPQLEPHDHKGYFDYTPQSRAINICEQAMLALAGFGITCEMHHHEVGRGQHEIDTRFDTAIRAADNVLTLKLALKAYTSGSPLKATWMPKPLVGFAGNGMHVHQSLWREQTNQFFGANKPHNLSDMAMSFLAGQLIHARALSAIVSPSVNSYKRLVTGYEAPVYICWGQTNRSALVRIPHSSHDKAAQGARLEYRAPDPSANPYLAFAALLAAGLDGIQSNLKPPAAVEEDVYHMPEQVRRERSISSLPTDLRDALDAFEQDEVVSGIFGQAKERYIAIKRQEWHDFSMQVTPWEVAHYL